MCNHQWVKIGQSIACAKCGITRLPNGKLLIDKALPNYLKKRSKEK